MHPGYFPVYFWSLVIFTSFWGYGELLHRRIDRPEFADLGWGLTAIWGMSVVLAIGRLLMAHHLSKAPPTLTLVALIDAATFFTLKRRRSHFSLGGSNLRLIELEP